MPQIKQTIENTLEAHKYNLINSDNCSHTLLEKLDNLISTKCSWFQQNALDSQATSENVKYI